MATKSVFDDVPAWPGNTPHQEVDRHHNKPPLEEVIPLEFREALLAERPDFLTRLDQAIESADRAEAVDDDSLGRCGDLVKLFRACDNHITKTHKAVKQPYLDGGRLVDQEKNGLIERLSAARKRVEDVANTFVAKREAAARAERERIAAEERAAAGRAAAAERERVRAEQEAAEAARNAASEEERNAVIDRAAEAAREAEEAMKAAALAPAAPSRSEPVRSDAGATVSGRQEWNCRVEDYLAAFKAVRTDPKVQEAVDAGVKRLVRAGMREIKGVKIWPVAKANFR